MVNIENAISNLELNIRWICNNPAYQSLGFGNVEMAMRDALELLKSQPHWIPVEESKPPECPYDCIVYTDKGCVMEASYLGMDSNHEWVSRYSWLRVTHWMPLPKPPKVCGTCKYLNEEYGICRHPIAIRDDVGEKDSCNLWCSRD